MNDGGKYETEERWKTEKNHFVPVEDVLSSSTHTLYKRATLQVYFRLLRPHTQQQQPNDGEQEGETMATMMKNACRTSSINLD